ncbi:ribonuclease H-like domain-containing protein [Tanacetum coccineum]
MAIGNLSITDFFQQLKSKADHLANLESPVKDTSLVTYAINGVRSKYLDAAHVIRLREKVPTFDELRSLMLLEESDMSNSSHGNSSFHNTSSSPTVLVAGARARCKFVHGANDLRPRPSNISAPQSRAATVPPNARTTPSHNNESQKPTVQTQNLPSGMPYVASNVQPTYTGGPTNMGYLFFNTRPGAHQFQSAQQFQLTQQLQYGLSGPPGFGSPNMKPIAPPQASHQATMLPHAFQTMTLQEPAWNMDTGASSHLAENTGKHTKLPFYSSVSHVASVFDIVHSDLWTSPISSESGIKYYAIFLDHFSHYVWVYPLLHKSDLFDTFVTFRAYVNQQFNVDIKALQCDHGGEFDNTRFHTLFRQHGIQFRFSCPKTSQQNGKSERMLRTLNNITRTLLFQAHIPPSYWVEALNMAAHLLNILPSSAINNEIPFTKLYNKPPTYDHLRVFGCLCFPHIFFDHKLQPRSTACVFLGYPALHRGYRCLDLSTNKIIISRHVNFDEEQFPFGSMTPDTPPSYDFLLTPHNPIPPMLNTHASSPPPNIQQITYKPNATYC